MSHSDAQDPPNEQQERAADISTYLHDQADQLADKAEQLDDQAFATHTEAEAIEVEADQMRERAEHLHQQAEQIDKAIEGSLPCHSQRRRMTSQPSPSDRGGGGY